MEVNIAWVLPSSSFLCAPLTEQTNEQSSDLGGERVTEWCVSSRQFFRSQGGGGGGQLSNFETFEFRGPHDAQMNCSESLPDLL